MKKRLAIIKNAHQDLGWLEFLFVNLMYQIGVTRWNPRRQYLTNRDYEQAIKIAEPGDVVLVGQHRRLSSLFIRGIFTHALVYVGDGECIHAYAKGVEKAKFEDLFSEYDAMVILRAPQISTDQAQGLVHYLHTKLGEPYDYWFDHTDDRAWFCSELICAALNQNNVNLSICTTGTLPTPQAFYKSELEPVFISAGLQVKDGQLRVTKT